MALIFILFPIKKQHFNDLYTIHTLVFLPILFIISIHGCIWSYLCIYELFSPIWSGCILLSNILNMSSRLSDHDCQVLISVIYLAAELKHLSLFVTMRFPWRHLRLEFILTIVERCDSFQRRFFSVTWWTVQWSTSGNSDDKIWPSAFKLETGGSLWFGIFLHLYY